MVNVPPVRKPLEVESLLDLMNYTPSPPWVLGGVLPENAVVMVSGLGHTSKTFLALDACVSVSTGTAWLSHFPTRHGVALYVGEDSSRTDIVRQMRKLLIGRGLTSEPPSEDLLFTVCKGASLNTDHEANRIAQLVFTVRPRLVVLDSLRYLSPGIDEDSSTEMSLVMERIKALRNIDYGDGHGPAVLLVHHNSRSGNARGSSTIFDAVDGALNLKLNKRFDRVDVKIEKRRCIEVEEFAYNNLWDLEKACLVVLENADSVTQEATAILALMAERPSIATADAVACLRANLPGAPKMTDRVLANRTDRLLQKLRNDKKIEKVRHGFWALKKGSDAK